MTIHPLKALVSARFFKVRYLLWLLVTMLACSVAARAGDCTVDDTYAKVCEGHHDDCGSVSKPCEVHISYAAAAKVSPNPVCIEQGTKITWIEDTDKYKFEAHFKTSPFVKGKKDFYGNHGNPVTSHPVDGHAKDCYYYAAQECLGSVCYPIDPKVIVNGGGSPTPTGMKKKK